MKLQADSGLKASAPDGCEARGFGVLYFEAPSQPAYHSGTHWPVKVFAFPILTAGTNRFFGPSNLITIMVDICTSWQFPDIISEDMIECINMEPSIDRLSIEVCAVIDIDRW
ncbi:unnamed protein product [Colias eurytheme]|nr:unnamed protein product [Colias eurytheme]